MSNLEKKLFEHHKKIAEEHCTFLTEKIFHPAFVMGWLHGAKHMRDEMINGKREDEYVFEDFISKKNF